jgi:MFS family permease
VQAGVSLHQASHLVERGLSPAAAATIVSTFSFTAAIAGLVFGLVTRRIGVRTCLALSGLFLGAGALLLLGVTAPQEGYLAAATFGVGIGGILTVLPLAWADYFGRASFGAIRGVALTMQVTAQASGPLISGTLRDLTGTYVVPFACFAALAALSAVLALFARAPKPPRPAPA